MQCNHCGTTLKEGMAFCSNCGFPVEQKVNSTGVNQMPDLMAPMSNVNLAQGNIQQNLNNNPNVYADNNQPNLMASMSNVNSTQGNIQQENMINNSQTSNLNSNSNAIYTNPNINIQPSSNFVNKNVNLKNNTSNVLSYSLGIISLTVTFFINIFIGIIIGFIGVGVSFYERKKGNIAGAKKGLLVNGIALAIGIISMVISMLLF